VLGAGGHAVTEQERVELLAALNNAESRARERAQGNTPTSSPPDEREALRPESTKTCPTCKSKGFDLSILGPDRCTFCDGTEGGNPPEPTRDYVKEALSIVAGTSLLLPERPHLTALYELYKLTDTALKDLLYEIGRNPQ